MLVICEDCAKKYNVDETRIKGDKARFTCQECGHIIVVIKPKPAAAPPSEKTKKPLTDEEAMAEVAAMISADSEKGGTVTAKKGKGMSFGVFLLIIVVLAAGGFYFYMTYMQ